jgi:hypothetical protein
MDNLICRAINEKIRAEIVYKCGRRIIEPHASGYDRKGNRKLRAYQVSGYSEGGNPDGWKLFNVDDIEEFYLLKNDYFYNPREGYNPLGDRAIPNIICKI